MADDAAPTRKVKSLKKARGGPGQVEFLPVFPPPSKITKRAREAPSEAGSVSEASGSLDSHAERLPKAIQRLLADERFRFFGAIVWASDQLAHVVPHKVKAPEDGGDPADYWTTRADLETVLQELGIVHKSFTMHSACNVIYLDVRLHKLFDDYDVFAFSLDEQYLDGVIKWLEEDLVARAKIQRLHRLDVPPQRQAWPLPTGLLLLGPVKFAVVPLLPNQMLPQGAVIQLRKPDNKTGTFSFDQKGILREGQMAQGREYGSFTHPDTGRNVVEEVNPWLIIISAGNKFAHAMRHSSTPELPLPSSSRSIVRKTLRAMELIFSVASLPVETTPVAQQSPFPATDNTPRQPPPKGPDRGGGKGGKGGGGGGGTGGGGKDEKGSDGTAGLDGLGVSFGGLSVRGRGGREDGGKDREVCLTSSLAKAILNPHVSVDTRQRLFSTLLR